ncbi:type III secretion system translocon subunit SctE [Stenotrophomonas sp. B1-1]|uniref:type III secretion system translocon subunit SctE n=1 Tax=Stenotrophomonas sp. B1-1 TaxID=2710648 RepID=UPI0013DA6B21|nr:type III secretion system translocon subunit SctE [Stenotrophomonas sp. B1-1]
MTTTIHHAPNGLRLTDFLDKSHEAARNVAGSLGSESIAPATESILAEIARQDASHRNQGPHRSVSANGAPQLRDPDAALLKEADERAANLSGDGFLTWVAASLQQVMVRQSLDSLYSRAMALLQKLAGKQQSAEQFSADYQAAQDAYGEALAAASGAAGEAGEAVTAAKAAKEEVARLQQELDAMSPSDPAYAGKQQQLSNASSHAGALQTAADAAVARSDAAAKSAADIGSQLQAMNQQAGRVSGTLSQTEQPNRTMSARLTELMAMLQQLLGYAREVNMQASAEAAVQALKAQETEMTHLAEERAEELAKAASTSKWLGCIGKIIGWVVTVVSVVAAPFTGGLSMALAGVGLTLMVTEEVTGFSVLGAALQPVIQLVVKLVQELTKVFASLLESMGVVDGDAIAQVLAFITAALVVAAVVVGGFMLAKGAVAKLLPNIVKQVFGQVSKEATRITTKMAASVAGKQAGAFMAKHGGTIAGTATAVGGATQVGTAVGGVVVANMHVTAAELLSDQENVKFNMGQTHLTLEALNEMITALEEAISAIIQSMDGAMDSRRSTAKFMAANIGAV